VDILFATKDLQSLCNDGRKSTRQLGSAAGARLRNRLDDLAAAADLSYCQNLPGHFHQLHGDRNGLFAIRLAGGLRLVLQPVAKPLPILKDGALDKSKITTIRVVSIEDYHD
jgi:proteic killer suppression protein